MVLVIGQQGVLSQSVEQLLAEAKATESIENLLEDAVVEKGCNKIHFWILHTSKIERCYKNAIDFPLKIKLL